MSITIRGGLVTPYTQDVTLAAGSASVPTFTIFLDDLPVGGLPGGAAFSFQVYDIATNTVVITYTPTITDPILGVMTVTLVTTDTSTLTPGDDLYYYSIYQVNVTANQVCVVTGAFDIAATARYPVG